MSRGQKTLVLSHLVSWGAWRSNNGTVLGSSFLFLPWLISQERMFHFLLKILSQYYCHFPDDWGIYGSLTCYKTFIILTGKQSRSLSYDKYQMSWWFSPTYPCKKKTKMEKDVRLSGETRMSVCLKMPVLFQCYIAGSPQNWRNCLCTCLH